MILNVVTSKKMITVYGNGYARFHNLIITKCAHIKM